MKMHEAFYGCTKEYMQLLNTCNNSRARSTTVRVRKEYCVTVKSNNPGTRPVHNNIELLLAVCDLIISPLGSFVCIAVQPQEILSGYRFFVLNHRSIVTPRPGLSSPVTPHHKNANMHVCEQHTQPRGNPYLLVQ